MNKDLYNVIKEEISLAPVAIASDTTTNGEIIDSLGYESVVFHTKVGVVTAGDVTPAVYESDSSTMVGETAVPSTRLIGAYATLDTSATSNSVGVVASKRYLRAKYTTANSANLLVDGTAILGDPHVASTR